MTQNISQITDYIVSNAHCYFSDLSMRDIHVAHTATIERPIATLLRYTLSDGTIQHRILAKIHHLVNAENPDSDRPRRFVVDVNAKYELYAVILRQIEKLFNDVDSTRFGVVRLLDTIPESRTLVMTEVAGSDLRRYFLKKNRLQSAVNGFKLIPIFHQVGEWLRIFHTLEPDNHVEVRPPDPDALIHDIQLMIAYLKQSVGREAYFDKVFSILKPYPPQILNGATQMGRMHGDFALRNILLDANQRITVIDTNGKWHTPIYEDISYFMIRLWTNQLQVITMGHAYSKKWIQQCEQAFLEGYFGSQAIPRKAIVFYEIMSLLDQWVSLNEALKFKTDKIVHRIRYYLMDDYYQKLLNRYIAELKSLRR